MSNSVNKNSKIKKGTHWSSIGEAGSLFGLRFLWFVNKVLGRKVMSWMLWPTVVYFILVRPDSRRASLDFLRSHHTKYPEYWSTLPDKSRPGYWHVARHFKEFSESVVDKVLAWFVEISPEQFDITNPEVIDTFLADSRGQLIIGSHLGNLEYCRGFMHSQNDRVMNVLMHDKHAQNYTRLMKQLNPDSRLNIFQVDDFDIATLLSIKDKIDAGEWVFIAGDRLPLSGHERTVDVKFMDRKAALPIGPYMLAKGLACPVKLIFSYCDYSSTSSKVHFEMIDFAEQVTFDRKARMTEIQAYAQRFADELERQCAKAPYQWFNFYDFWSKREDV